MTACKKDDQTTPTPATTASTPTTCRLSELSWQGSTTYSNTYTFDNQGRVSKSKDINTGKEGLFAYDTSGYLLTYTTNNVDGQGKVYSSEVRKFTYMNGRLTQLTYTSIVKGRVELEKKIMIVLNATGHIASTQTSDGLTRSYSYDNSGNLILLKSDDYGTSNDYEEEYSNYDTQRNPAAAILLSEAHRLVINLYEGTTNGFSKNNPHAYKHYQVDASGNRTLLYKEVFTNFSYNQSGLPTQFTYDVRTPQGNVLTTGVYSFSYTNCQ